MGPSRKKRHYHLHCSTTQYGVAWCNPNESNHELSWTLLGIDKFINIRALYRTFCQKITDDRRTYPSFLLRSHNLKDFFNKHHEVPFADHQKQICLHMTSFQALYIVVCTKEYQNMPFWIQNFSDWNQKLSVSIMSKRRLKMHIVSLKKILSYLKMKTQYCDHAQIWSQCQKWKIEFATFVSPFPSFWITAVNKLMW